MVLSFLQAALTLFPLAVVAQNTTYKSTFTWYGTNDQNGSPNCNSNAVACGFYTFPGYAAGVSQNLYGTGPGQGIGSACGTCWRLTIETDQNGNKVKNAGSSIVVIVNNLCPVDDPKYGHNPLCAQSDLNSTNQYGGVVDFNLCNDDGAHAALLGPAGTGLAVGSATQVDCNEWTGTKKTDCGSDCSGSSSSGSSSLGSSPSGAISSSPTVSSSNGQIGGSGGSSSASQTIGPSSGNSQTIGAGGKNAVLCMWGLLLPLIIMLRL